MLVVNGVKDLSTLVGVEQQASPQDWQGSQQH